jgi:hypothetical protein
LLLSVLLLEPLLSELVELSEVDVVLDVSLVWALATVQATSTDPATPAAARAAVIPPTLRSPFCLGVVMT